MADQFRYKLMTDLTAKADPSDTDLFAVGNNGSSGLRKLTFASIANAIKTKLASWTFSNLTTSSKTLPGAVNELNSKITEYAALTSTTHTISGRYMKIGYLIIATGYFTYKSGVNNVETNLPAPYSAVPFTVRNASTGSMGTAFFESNHLSTYLTSATLNDGNIVRFSFSYIANQE